MSADTIESLRQQLADCERERDYALARVDSWTRDAQTLQAQLATVTAKRDELVAALKDIATHSVCCDARHIAKAALAKLGADKTGEQHG